MPVGAERVDRNSCILLRLVGRFPQPSLPVMEWSGVLCVDVNGEEKCRA